MVLGTGGYGNVFYLSTNAKGCNATAIWRAYKRGAAFANPCFTQIHPTCIPVSGELPVEAHADERVAPQRRPRLGAEARRATAAPPGEIPESGARLLPRAEVPELRQPRAARHRVARGQGRCATKAAASGRAGAASTSTSPTPSSASATSTIRERYGNLFEMYERITDENPYEVPMRIYPAVHYTMGGLWVDYNLMSTIPGLHVIGEANFSDHGANRLGASALMQGLADGYFIVSEHHRRLPRVGASSSQGGRAAPRGPRGARPRSTAQTERLPRHQGQADGGLVPPRAGQDSCGTTAAWRGTRPGCSEALELIPELREEFWRNVNVPGSDAELNQALEKAGRVADFLELGELMCLDALHREESCGGHFREEYQTDGRRGAARRRALRLRGGLGVRRRRPAAPAAQGAARRSSTCTWPSGATSERLDSPSTSGGRRDRRRPGGWSATRPTTSARTCRSSRCSTSSTSG